MRLVLVVACAFLSTAALAESYDWTATGTATVIDGDTIKLDGVTVRLSGIDAPEKDQLCTMPDGRAWDCGVRAGGHLESLISGGAVTCYGQGKDQYKRRLAVCHSKTVNLNLAMVLHGWAVDYPQFSKGKYAAAEADARKHKQALWIGTFMKPWDWRRTRPAI
jgi:endonuclease YncB( thermonuclease family)